MLEMEVIQTSTSTSTSTKKHVREPPSVPFLWEVRPGIPKKDWKPEASSSVTSALTVPPVKLIASFPFLWEEKPGIPLPSYSQPSQELVLYNYMPKDVEIDESIDSLWEDNDAYDDEEEQNMSILGLETIGSETDYYYSSAPSLLANCLVSSLAVATAIPTQNISTTRDIGCELESESPSSPASENESTTSSYATGNSSLVGSSFLECLFPLFPPNSGFLGKVGSSDHTHKPPELWNQKLALDSNGSTMVRRPPTLGELIMMSRRRSCRRKATQLRNHDMSMELTKNGAFGCCGFGNGSKVIEALHGKQLPRLKLVWHKQKLQLESFFATGASFK